jgi:hypothetical protein
VKVAFPDRDRRLRSDALAPVGMLAECSQSVPSVCLALDQVGARDWASYAGWATYADASLRRGWVRHRQRRGATFVMSLLSLIQGSQGQVDVQRSGGGWLNIVVLPDPSRSGSTLEIRGDLDAAMYVSVRSVTRSLFVRVVRVWDPTVP